MKKKVGDQALLVAPHIYRKENDFSKPIGGGSNPIVQNLKDSYKSNIFVKFIPKEVTHDQFVAEFSKAGKIASIKLKDHQ
jgi:RNA recognition motif-containing protein